MEWVLNICIRHKTLQSEDLRLPLASKSGENALMNTKYLEKKTWQGLQLFVRWDNTVSVMVLRNMPDVFVLSSIFEKPYALHIQTPICLAELRKMQSMVVTLIWKGSGKQQGQLMIYCKCTTMCFKMNPFLKNAVVR